MQTILGGDSFVPGRGQPRSDRNSDENLLDPGEKFLHSSRNFIQLNELSGSHDLSLFSGTTSEGGLPEKSDNSDAVLEFINHILMEEELDNNKINMSQDSLVLQALEKSFYDVIGQRNPPSPYEPSLDSNVDIINPVSSTTFKNSNTSLKGGAALLSSDDFSWVQADNHILMPCSESDFRSPCSGRDTVYGPCDSSICKCRRGLEEASQTHTSMNQVIADLGNEASLPSATNEDTIIKPKNLIRKVATNYLSNESRGKKNHQREDNDNTEEERDSKHSAVYLGESELSDIFDKVLLSDEGSSKDEVRKKKGRAGKIRTRKNMSKKGEKQDNHNRDKVDLTNLLTRCAQAIASCDQKTAFELLKEIRKHSSPFGDASQRLVHCFANGLEARLAGTKGQMYAGYLSYIVNATPVSNVIKVFQVYSSICPFLRAPFLFVNGTLNSLSRKETSLHIIDFGIQYGFQWPLLFQSLSKRPGGPPKVRITGIEVPSTGFRPFEGVEETRRRLAYYCERFDIPFEYFHITKKWETIRPQDFSIDKDEFVVVNCMYRLQHLADESVVAGSPRNAVLELIRSINPNVFIHGIVNGSYSSPLFVRRFREALFHFSAIFDMFEVCLPRDDETRVILETAIYGKDAINVIACEGGERFDRPETCNQWQLRLQRAGFRQMSLSQDLLKEIRRKVKSNYHKDYMVEENNDWMLLGWKGRTIHGLSCWKPV